MSHCSTTAIGTIKLHNSLPLWKATIAIGAWKHSPYLTHHVGISHHKYIMQVFLANFQNRLSETCVQDDNILVGR